MFLEDVGITTLSCTRTTHLANPNEHLFVIPTTHSNGHAVKVGDLCVFADIAYNDEPALPASVVPAGFTLITGQTGSQQNGDGALARYSYKILAAADIGATKAGMVGGNTVRKQLMTFEMTRPVLSVAVAGVVADGPQGTDVVQLTVSPPPSAGAVLVTFAGLGELAHTPVGVNITGSSPYNASGTDPVGTLATARTYYTCIPYGKTPLVYTFNMADASSVYANWEAGCYMVLN